ncbi:hypothetical protein EVAR_64562_1 [Eumeta japonica]|uniref:Uncharacterized protein n=1 Tax=Eumeta variegata TaxID=151549 RepID=A0A4C1Z9V5_EUMVA|nr:hypothetical protein EVAR_64562_1 [Eumeta japonica]
MRIERYKRTSTYREIRNFPTRTFISTISLQVDNGKSPTSGALFTHTTYEKIMPLAPPSAGRQWDASGARRADSALVRGGHRERGLFVNRELPGAARATQRRREQRPIPSKTVLFRYRTNAMICDTEPYPCNYVSHLTNFFIKWNSKQNGHNSNNRARRRPAPAPARTARRLAAERSSRQNNE